MNNPILYSPEVERPEADEAETTRELVATLTKISAKVFEDTHRAHRSVHAKSHALVCGILTVDSNLPQELAQGLFASPDTHPVLLRLSSSPGDLLPDSVSTHRGLAIKIFEVAGERLPNANGNTQDFLFANGPAFTSSDAKHFLKNLKLLAGTTDKAQGLKSALSLALRGVERVVEAAGGQSGTIKALGGQPATHPLGDTYFTQVPMRYGLYVAKVRLRPTSPALTALTHKSIDITHAPNALRDEMREFFNAQTGIWNLEVQLCRDLEKMPVEDASKVWAEDLSPYQRVAQITASPQHAWPEDSAEKTEDALFFTPWHGITAHQPLGSVMRVRKASYEASAQFRALHNNVSVDEPSECPVRL